MVVHDVLTVGRSGVDVYPLQVNTPLNEVKTFQKFLGGSPMNVAVAAARLGEDVAILTGVGDDPFGKYVRDEMRRLGVSDEFVITDSNLNTPVTFCELVAEAPFFFYREPSAPDLQIKVSDLPEETVKNCKVFWFSGTGLCEDPSYTTHIEALKMRGRKSYTIFDMDWRPMFWADPEEAKKRYAQCLEFTDVAVGNRAECEIAVGEKEPDRAADALLERGVKIAIVKQGSEGALAKTADERAVVPVLPATVINGSGSGDAFGGSLIHGLLQEWGLEKIIQGCNAAGGIVASRLECSTAMPTEAEIWKAITAGTCDVLNQEA